VLKFVMSDRGEASGTELAEAPALDDGMARVKVWIPPDSQAQIGEDVFLPTPGFVKLPPGPTLMQLYFDNGRKVNCSFEAGTGDAVRYVPGEGGRPALSVNDGAAIPCQDVQAAEGEGSGDAGPG